MMEATYDVAQWATETLYGRQVFNHSFRLVGREFRGWRLLNVVPRGGGQDAVTNAYIWQSASDPEHQRIRFDITECSSWQQAQESLRQYLMNCMRPNIPRGTKDLAQVGDILFVNREPYSDIAAGIWFSRGNVCSFIRSSGAKTVDVSDIAIRLDRSLSEPPLPKDVERGTVQALEPRTIAAKANEPYTLIENVQDVTPHGEWLKIIVPDGQLSRRGEAILYIPAQSGEKRVSLFVAKRP